MIYFCLVLFSIILPSFEFNIPPGFFSDGFDKRSGPLIINRHDTNFGEFSSSFGGRTKRSASGEVTEASSSSKIGPISNTNNDNNNSNITAKVQ